MKALTIRPQWAALIASGKKTIETRTWKTSHRGDLLICASARPPDGENAGHAVCIVELVECRVMVVEDEAAACFKIFQAAYAWELRNVRHVVPFPVLGKLHIFEVNLPKSCLRFESKIA